MTIDGLKEVQESVMRIEAGLSTYEKELALMGEDYQDIFRQQVRNPQSGKSRTLTSGVDSTGVSAADSGEPQAGRGDNTT